MKSIQKVLDISYNVEYNDSMSIKSDDYIKYKIQREVFKDRRNCNVYANVVVWGWVIAIILFYWFFF